MRPCGFILGTKGGAAWASVRKARLVLLLRLPYVEDMVSRDPPAEDMPRAGYFTSWPLTLGMDLWPA